MNGYRMKLIWKMVWFRLFWRETMETIRRCFMRKSRKEMMNKQIEDIEEMWWREMHEDEDEDY